MPEKSRLRDLISVGPAFLRDFEMLGVSSVHQLARRNPEKLYQSLCRIKGQPQDICCLDVFRAAVARRGIQICLSSSANGGIGAGSERRAMPAARKRELTIPDLVLLSLLAERPMHGYEANLELARREVQDWAGISRPQVYYSLEKLARIGLIRAAESDEPSAGPERSVFATTAKGRTSLADALERADWTAGREWPPFLDLGGVVLAGAAGRVPAAVAATAGIPGERIGAGKSGSAISAGRGWAQLSRSGLDAEADDCAIPLRTGLAAKTVRGSSSACSRAASPLCGTRRTLTLTRSFSASSCAIVSEYAVLAPKETLLHRR